MPCRPKLCQRLAAQLSHPPPTPFGSNHTWISEELLSEAFNRYVRVSHATRRYGSNVPGPLEARRRASKRRMGCAVAPTSMGPPGGDFGALFGAGAGGNAVENGWTWKAPGIQPAPTNTTLNGWNWGAKRATSYEPPTELDEFLEVPLSEEEIIEESREAFAELLQEAEGAGTLEKSDVAVLTEFLSSSADEPAAKNVSRLIQWMSGRSVSTPAWQAITALLCDKIILASIGNEDLLEVIRALPGVFEWEHDDGARQRLHGIYAAFSGYLEDRALSDGLLYQTMFEEIHKTTRDAQACSRLIEMFAKTTSNHSPQLLSENVSKTLLAIHNLGGEDLTQTRLLKQLATALSHNPSAEITEVLRLSTSAILDNGGRSWAVMRLRALTWLDCVASASFSVDHMSIVYAEIVKRLPPHQIAEHVTLKSLKPVDIARFLLRIWLPNTDFDITPDTRFESSKAGNRKRSLKTVRYGLRPLSAADLPTIELEFELLYSGEEKVNAWSALLKAFKRNGVAYDNVVNEVFQICRARHRPKTISHIFIRMLVDHELTLPNHVYISLIEHLLANDEHYLAYKIFRVAPSIAITDVPKLPLALLKDASVDFDMFEMLLREPDSTPMEWRERLKLSVSPGHVEVVHLIAHTAANVTSLRSSQAYRRVWSLYRWLQDRGAPLEPLISRAFVTAGILRPIREYKWVPDERLEYILSIVEKVEGLKMREDVEILARHLRSSVHDKVLTKRQAARDADAWIVRSTKLANDSKFRFKRWTKLKPVPTRDGKSFRVPPPQDDIPLEHSVRRFEAAASAPTRNTLGTDDMRPEPLTAVWRPTHDERETERVFSSPPAAMAVSMQIEEASKQEEVRAVEPVLWRPMGDTPTPEEMQSSSAGEHRAETSSKLDDMLTGG